MQKFSIVLAGLLAIYGMVASDNQHGRYYAELQAFKQAPDAKIMFDEDAHEGLALIQRDMITYKNLTAFQRFVRTLFQLCDVVLVTPETMPLLYNYVEDICKKANIKTPTVFITRKDGFFNAFAQKLLMSSGGILIGQKLMKELSDDALEAVVAHELGHIKHNHVNKILCLNIMGLILLSVLAKKATTVNELMPKDNEIMQGNALQWYGKFWLFSNILHCLTALVINKRFEKEADAFACENGKAEGIIEFFELLLHKDTLREEEFAAIYAMLMNNKNQLKSGDYYSLLLRYYSAWTSHLFTNAYKTLYYKTFWGAHPSPQARIEAAKKYLV